MASNIVERLPRSPERFPLGRLRNPSEFKRDPNARDTAIETLDPDAIRGFSPAGRDPLADFHVVFGDHNPNMEDPVTGMAASRAIIPYVTEGGGPWVEPPEIDFGNGVTGYGAISPTYLVTMSVASGGTGYPDGSYALEFSGGNATGMPIPPEVVYSDGSRGRYPLVPVVTVSGGTVISAAISEQGSGITGDLTATVVDINTREPIANTSPATFTFNYHWSVARTVITAGGSGYTRCTIATDPASPTQYNNDDRVAPRFRPVISGGAITGALILEGGANISITGTNVTLVGGEYRIPLSFTGNGTGAAGYAVLERATVRAFCIEQFGAAKTTGATDTATNPDGDDATVGYDIGQAPTLGTFSATTIAGATSNVDDMNGISIPVPDNGNFTIIALIELSNSAADSIVIGSDVTASPSSASTGGGIRFNGLTVYAGIDYATVASATTMTLPAGATAGDLVPFIYRCGGRAGQVTGGNPPVQQYDTSLQAGDATALGATAGTRRLCNPMRLFSIGPVHIRSSAFSGPMKVVEVVAWYHDIGADGVSAALDRMEERATLRGQTIVRAA